MSDSDALLTKAERFIRSAQLLANDGGFDSAASRLYYAMFYLAEAMLAERGASLSSHSAVISAFGQQVAKAKEIDLRFHRALLTGFSQRQLGDYAVSPGLSDVDIDSCRYAIATLLQCESYPTNREVCSGRVVPRLAKSDP